MDSHLLRLLGAPTGAFGPSLANLSAGLVIALLLVAFGGTGLAWSDFSPALLASLIGGIALLFWLWRTTSLRVRTFTNGFVVWHRGKVEVFLWTRIAEVIQQRVIS
jgi:hypothetical protein